MAEQTTFLKIPFPSETENPFWNTYNAQMVAIDEYLFMAKVMNNLFIGGGGSIGWNGVLGTLTWTADFVVPMLANGKKILVRFGPDEINRTVTLSDGQALVIDVPMAMSVDAVVHLRAINSFDPAKKNEWAFAWRIGSTLQIKGLGVLT